MSLPFILSPDGYEMQFATNHLGHFLLTQLLLDTLKQSSPSRVVSVSSIGHYFFRYYNLFLGFNASFEKEALSQASEPHYDPGFGYARSKFANVLFAQELARRHAKDGVYSNSVHPGVIATRLYDGVFEEGVGYELFGFRLTVLDLFGETLTKGVRYLWGTVCMDVPDGAVTQLYAAASPLVYATGAPITGKYFHPQAREAPPSGWATPEAQEKLWEASLGMVAPFL